MSPVLSRSVVLAGSQTACLRAREAESSLSPLPHTQTAPRSDGLGGERRRREGGRNEGGGRGEGRGGGEGEGEVRGEVR